MTGIYKIINKTNGKYYVGSSTRLDDVYGRWYKHRHKLTKNEHINSHLQSAWNKYGPDSFSFVIVQEVPESKLLEVEQEYLNKACLEKDKCYNQNYLANRCAFSEDIIRKRNASIKKYFSIPQNNPMFGKLCAVETREKIRKKRLGQRLSEETKQKLSQYKPSLDKTLYTFQHASGEAFTGIRVDFFTKHPEIPQPNVCWSIKNHKSTRGWTISAVLSSVTDRTLHKTNCA